MQHTVCCIPDASYDMIHILYTVFEILYMYLVSGFQTLRLRVYNLDGKRAFRNIDANSNVIKTSMQKI